MLDELFCFVEVLIQVFASDLEGCSTVAGSLVVKPRLPLVVLACLIPSRDRCNIVGRDCDLESSE